MKLRISIISIIIILFLFIGSCKNSNQTAANKQVDSDSKKQEWAIVIHGGAGAMSTENLTPDLDKEYRVALAEALNTGKKILSEGGTALDAIEKTIRIMEDNPLFNAGKGAVFTHEGRNELDAAIMDGSNLAAGAVAGVIDIRNPITAARTVMTNSSHVMLTGAGASEFAREQGLEIVLPSYFHTEKRYDELQEILMKEKHGTVGCCALDKHGNLAAGTSTGGMTNKRYNRVGDVPIIGAGTYANNATCAVSATGHGEYFIRWTVAHDISALMEYKGLSLKDASELVVNDKLVKAGGSGGVICVDKSGNVSIPFNSKGMFRGFATADGKEGVFIYRDETASK
ncbi:MAG: beta-aspartyl-peptidase [Bacteroidetes bacterium GWE2_41_25]|nr:MAG: beta-aspartyl-peptidase [Bacteroidetes bacterium GWA2_40_15]OFX88505.1 MAG: beta-aspartyl-peptidase [Bacteroidetes bacterium GWC2_40_22]OFY08314.1 MAG: beta-aspartyl-peptidase [Bacteroidetes bacterium GWE2_41_25]HBH82615.1 beta-aspartyl-peptidase [Bacteroidales bacterium]HBQ84696.1 beta-aspartyl-peptidase [Bacteroidales bacterium]